jgi:N-carbamoylputrescine amidase
MARTLSVAALQSAYGADLAVNIARTSDLVRQAAAQGAQVILPPELFQGPYFCVAQEERWFAEAHPWRTHPCTSAMSALAAELGVVIPTSIYEKEGPHYFNSLVMIDATGEALGVYRKSHIPDGPGYMEKYYFRPGDTGFRVWDTKFGRIGSGICWDQWYPEAARAMQGHAVANVIPVVGANRTGFEPWDNYPNGGQRFYGSSFIADHRGDLVADLGRDDEGVITATFDLDFLATHRAAWGFFRDRRPDLYGALASPRPA